MELDGTQITEFKDIAAHFQVGKPLIIKLKNMSPAEKGKAASQRKAQSKSSKRTRDQVRPVFCCSASLIVFFWLLLLKQLFYDMLDKAVFEWIDFVRSVNLPATCSFVRSVKRNVSVAQVTIYCPLTRKESLSTAVCRTQWVMIVAKNAVRMGGGYIRLQECRVVELDFTWGGQHHLASCREAARGMHALTGVIEWQADRAKVSMELIK